MTPPPDPAETAPTARGADPELPSASERPPPAGPRRPAFVRRARGGTPASRRAFRWGAGLVAVAAAVGLVVWLPGSTPTLPEYAATIEGGTRVERSGSEVAPRVFRADERVELRLRPATEVTIPIHAAIFRVSANQSPERLTLPLEVAPSGAVRLSVRASELLPEEGDHELTVVVAPSRTPIDGLQVAGAARASFALRRDDTP